MPSSPDEPELDDTIHPLRIGLDSNAFDPVYPQPGNSLLPLTVAETHMPPADQLGYNRYREPLELVGEQFRPASPSRHNWTNQNVTQYVLVDNGHRAIAIPFGDPAHYLTHAAPPMPFPLMHDQLDPNITQYYAEINHNHCPPLPTRFGGPTSHLSHTIPLIALPPTNHQPNQGTTQNFAVNYHTPRVVAGALQSSGEYMSRTPSLLASPHGQASPWAGPPSPAFINPTPRVVAGALQSSGEYMSRTPSLLASPHGHASPWAGPSTPSLNNHGSRAVAGGLQGSGEYMSRTPSLLASPHGKASPWAGPSTPSLNNHGSRALAGALQSPGEPMSRTPSLLASSHGDTSPWQGPSTPAVNNHGSRAVAGALQVSGEYMSRTSSLLGPSRGQALACQQPIPIGAASNGFTDHQPNQSTTRNVAMNNHDYWSLATALQRSSRGQASAGQDPPRIISNDITGHGRSQPTGSSHKER
ncbi:uncharacterized protein N7479_005634 [Penicillium vulpinum]|uniref:uncharacterized protein n=1 Tax=Penicillium vulpinum TaxID=29845 RepID=UPI0025477BA9|nr:uncharacterized protein N7479_005634 [Penicillium vulpinum]KAJ5958484.1 hypothetical protein N7479_005634 [Penicillium vulpinum]